jgi:cytochrome c peroxidase
MRNRLPAGNPRGFARLAGLHGGPQTAAYSCRASALADAPNAPGTNRSDGTPRRRFVAMGGGLTASAVALMLAGPGPTAGADRDSRQLVFRNASGLVRTITDGDLDLRNPFFQSLGTNGRSCATCHAAAEGWSITPDGVQARFVESEGRDPIFRNNDGSNCEGALPVSRDEQWDAYSLLLTRGLIRVGLNVPSGAEFTVDDVDDPYRCGVSTHEVSVYRRPLPSTNLRFLSAVMWDGRESSAASAILEDLTNQANNATRGHGAAFRDITGEQARQIVAFEDSLITAQAYDNQAGTLSAEGARGGPAALSAQPFFIGINDPIGFNPTGASFTPLAFDLFDRWAALPRSLSGPIAEGRRAIARGQGIFNSKPITLTGVGGLNDETFSNTVTLPASFTATCTVCHDAPNVGNHSVKAPLDIGLTTAAVAPYLPVYTLRNTSTGETVETTDPGRALITGKWRDVNRFKGPVLRGLAGRAPYFHNGSAATLDEAVDFYDTRFSIGLTRREKADLVAFLRAL